MGGERDDGRTLGNGGQTGMSTAPLRIISDAATHEGRVRKNNEDSFCARPDQGLWCVADGMGGHQNGEFASAAIVEAFEALAPSDAFDASCASIAGAIHAANARIHVEGADGKEQMGSTVVALFVRDRQFAVFWVGDSRAYLLRGGSLIQLTRDHTQVQALIDRGIMTEAEAKGHPMGHVLARAVGVEDAVEVDVIVDEVLAGDIFLLCSDGLHGTMAEPEIRIFLETAAQGSAPEKMVARTLDLGAPDNVTVVTVAAREPTLLSMDTPVETVR